MKPGFEHCPYCREVKQIGITCICQVETPKFTGVVDSGKREEFNTGSRRDTNEGKPRPDLITPIAEYQLAMHYAHGAVKYGDRNWEKGQPLHRYIESLQRHILKEKLGFTDENHAAAIIWNAMAYLHTKFMIEAGELPSTLDTMPKYSDVVRNKLLKMYEEKENNLSKGNSHD
jgi:hypothetical protein